MKNTKDRNSRKKVFLERIVIWLNYFFFAVVNAMALSVNGNGQVFSLQDSVSTLVVVIAFTAAIITCVILIVKDCGGNRSIGFLFALVYLIYLYSMVN